MESILNLIMPILAIVTFSAVLVFSGITDTVWIKYLIKFIGVIGFFFFSFIIIKRFYRLISNFVKGPRNTVASLIRLDETFIDDGENLFTINVLVARKELKLESQKEDYKKLWENFVPSEARVMWYSFEEEKPQIEIDYYPLNNILVDAKLIEKNLPN